MKPLLVGEDNPYGNNPRYALYCEPKNSAGWRLCTLVMGMTTKEYVRSFDRVNLCSKKWSIKEARATANKIKVERSGNLAPIILLGAKVCEAFAVAFEPFSLSELFDDQEKLIHCYVVLPHPSGRSRLWTDDAFDCARDILAQAGVLPVVPPTAAVELEDLPDSDTTTARPARCSNCGILVTEIACPECGPMGAS